MIKIYDFVYYSCVNLVRVLWKIQDWALHKSNKLVIVVEESDGNNSNR